MRALAGLQERLDIPTGGTFGQRFLGGLGIIPNIDKTPEQLRQEAIQRSQRGFLQQITQLPAPIKAGFEVVGGIPSQIIGGTAEATLTAFRRGELPGLREIETGVLGAVERGEGAGKTAVRELGLEGTLAGSIIEVVGEVIAPNIPLAGLIGKVSKTEDIVDGFAKAGKTSRVGRAIAKAEVRGAGAAEEAAGRIPKGLESLAEEARKYKSAEEFVKSQPILFRGEGGTGIKVARLGSGTYVSRNRDAAAAFADITKGKVNEYYPKPGLKLMSAHDEDFINIKESVGLKYWENTNTVKQSDMIAEKAKNLGYDGIESDDPIVGTVIFDRSNLLTKSQLTDLYNQALKIQPDDAIITYRTQGGVSRMTVKEARGRLAELERDPALTGEEGAEAAALVEDEIRAVKKALPGFDAEKEAALKITTEEMPPSPPKPPRPPAPSAAEEIARDANKAEEVIPKEVLRSQNLTKLSKVVDNLTELYSKRHIIQREALIAGEDFATNELKKLNITDPIERSQRYQIMVKSFLAKELPKAKRDEFIRMFDTIDMRWIVKEIDTAKGWEAFKAREWVNKMMGLNPEQIQKRETEIVIDILSGGKKELVPQASKVVQALSGNREKVTLLGTWAPEVLNLPRAWMASVDLSMPLRQAIVSVARHPVRALKNTPMMIKAAFSKDEFQKVMDAIAEDPNFPLMTQGRVRLAMTDVGGGFGRSEEPFVSTLAEKFPLMGGLVRGSNRAAVAFLNKTRADTFSDLVGKARKAQIEISDEWLDAMKGFVNAATGRGDLGKFTKEWAPFFNTVLFSPRLMASRLMLLNPVYYYRLPPVVRREALESALSMTGMILGLGALAKGAGAKFGTDPRSADFLKIKVGDTRIDMTGGFNQYMTLLTRLVTGQYVSSRTGVIHTVGEGFKPLGRGDYLFQFVERKQAPVASFIWGWLQGTDPFGNKFEIPKQVGERVVPMVLQDIKDIYDSGGFTDLWIGVPAIFGAGAQTYIPTAKEAVSASRSARNYYRKLAKRGRADEAARYFSENSDIINIGRTLEPLIKRIDELKRRQDLNPSLETELQPVIDRLEEVAERRLEEVYGRGGKFVSRNTP